MPFSWVAVMVQMGFIAWWLRNRWGWVAAAVILTIVGATYIPMYEVMARRAGFWYYQNVPMILGACPYYVIVAEALICLSLVFLVDRMEKQSWPIIVALAVAESVWMYLATRLSIALTT